jgi:hypothetical protein
LLTNDHHPFMEMFGRRVAEEQFMELPESLI